MRSRALIGFLLVILTGWGQLACGDSDFYAHYTKVDSGESFEQYSRTGEYADVVAAFDNIPGKLVFWRGSSYLPYWETSSGKWHLEEIVPRSGDGDAKMPDRVNAFSRVQIIETTPEKALILWRYLPVFGGINPHTGLAREKFVEEYFEVFADGSVRRAVHQSGYSADDWRKPHGGVVQQLKLTAQGVKLTEQKRIANTEKFPQVAGRPIKQSSGSGKPLYRWSFDEGAGWQTHEVQSGASCTIAGRRPFWRQGVSGTSLQIDGYTTAVTLPVKPHANLADGLTLEGWAAIGANPWNWAPIVQQGDDDGFFLGVGGDGKPALRLNVNQQLCELVGAKPLPLRRWVHVAGTYDAATGAMKLYINGAPAGERTIDPGAVNMPDAPICIGKGGERVSAFPVFKWRFKAEYALDGLLDEVRIYNEPLSAAAIKTGYEDFKPDSDAAEFAVRAFPDLTAIGAFGAKQERLNYYDAWDNLFDFGPFASVVVGFDDSPAKFVFWHGMNFVPHVVGEKGEWYDNEWNETWNSSGGVGCQEPLCDKESYFSHVRVLENTPARVVVHWRFACADSKQVVANYVPATGWGDYSDWYWVIYPDGVAAKTMQLFTSGERNHEFNEGVFSLPPGVEIADILNEKGIVTISDLTEVKTYDWTRLPAEGVDADGRKIQVLNFVGAYDPVVIGDFTGGRMINRSGASLTRFSGWNHYPICQIASDGNAAKTSDRARHISLSRVLMNDYDAQYGDRPYQMKVMLEGITNKSIDELNVLGRSWLQAPEIQAVDDCRELRYDKPQRAFILTATGADPEFAINATDEKPLYNPAFIVSDWGCDDVGAVRVNGQTLPVDCIRQGVVRDTRGVRQLIVWLKGVWTNNQTLKISGAVPR
ncbi:MAG: LamG domain-containing protein [Sedimentisphaerales bacterium]|nr:LamG domain-containing protein [Sedimentisphaerales bacterium]